MFPSFTTYSLSLSYFCISFWSVCNQNLDHLSLLPAQRFHLSRVKDQLIWCPMSPFPQPIPISPSLPGLQGAQSRHCQHDMPHTTSHQTRLC
jgi:hypothetical protein